MRIGVVGLGHAGSINALYLAHLGHDVTAYDIQVEKRRQMSDGSIGSIEPGLDNLYNERVASKIEVVDDLAPAVRNMDCVMVEVTAPTRGDGSVDHTHAVHVADQMGYVLDSLPSPPWILMRSTMMPDDHKQVMLRLPGTAQLRYVVYPEFTREGRAVPDTLRPDMMVFGVEPDVTHEFSWFLKYLYDGPRARLGFRPVPYVAYMTRDEASMVKYAQSALNAVQVTFANEIGQVCHQLGVDGVKVMRTVTQSMRAMSSEYLRAGLPYGGACLPKDVAALGGVAGKQDGRTPVISGLNDVNNAQVQHLLEGRVHNKAMELFGQPAHFGIVGLASEENTNDCRESVPGKLAEGLLVLGHRVTAYDPLVIAHPLVERWMEDFRLTDNPEDLRSCNMLLLCHSMKKFPSNVLAGKHILDAAGGWELRELVSNLASSYEPIY